MVGVYGSVQISVTNTMVCGPTFLALWGGGGCQISRKKALRNTWMAPYMLTLGFMFVASKLQS